MEKIIIEKLDEILKWIRIRNPIDQLFQISSSIGYVVDYKQRKHIYFWAPSAMTLVVDNYGTGPLAAQQWVNCGFADGTVIKTNSATLAILIVRCSDEVVP